MICEKCARQIADDSVFCSYCGVLVEAPKKADDDDCIKPHMPKKHCATCNKELPGSAIAPLCAMCTIRQRNRELEERRKNDDASYATRDRYDTSDEFDQTVFQQNSSKYYRGDRFAQARSAQGSRASVPESLFDLDEKEKNKSSKVVLIVIICLVVAFIFLPMIFSFAANTVFSGFGTRTPEPDFAVSAVEEALYDDAVPYDVNEDAESFEVTEDDNPLLYLDGDELLVYMRMIGDEELIGHVDSMTQDELDTLSAKLTNDQIDEINLRLNGE